MRSRDLHGEVEEMENGKILPRDISIETASINSVNKGRKGGANFCTIIGVIVSFLLFLSLYGAYHVHQLHEEGIVFQHRKFVGDFSNMAKDMDVIGDKEEVKEVAPLINRDKGFLSSVLKIPALEMGNGDEVVADDNVIVSVISDTDTVEQKADKCRSTIPRSWHGKHTVEPPAGPMDLVCCRTTKGVFNIAVHPKWAPIGAGNFLDMVKSDFFSSKVPLFRALKGFLIQFGLSSLPEVQKEYEHSHMGGKGGLPDDPQWLPAGPPGRINDKGIKRFQRGYLAYAGAGKNSRGTQLILSFQDNEYLGGGSPWEVPWGKLFGDESYETLDSIYTGYGEKVSQGKIRNRGREYLDSEVPLVDYINSCDVVAEGVDYVD